MSHGDFGTLNLVNCSSLSAPSAYSMAASILVSHSTVVYRDGPGVASIIVYLRKP